MICSSIWLLYNLVSPGFFKLRKKKTEESFILFDYFLKFKCTLGHGSMIYSKTGGLGTPLNHVAICKGLEFCSCCPFEKHTSHYCCEFSEDTGTPDGGNGIGVIVAPFLKNVNKQRLYV